MSSGVFSIDSGAPSAYDDADTNGPAMSPEKSSAPPVTEILIQSALANLASSQGSPSLVLTLLR